MFLKIYISQPRLVDNFIAYGDNSHKNGAMADDDDLSTAELPTASGIVWIGLIVTVTISFWGQAVITEDR